MEEKLQQLTAQQAELHSSTAVTENTKELSTADLPGSTVHQLRAEQQTDHTEQAAETN